MGEMDDGRWSRWALLLMCDVRRAECRLPQPKATGGNGTCGVWSHASLLVLGRVLCGGGTTGEFLSVLALGLLVTEGGSSAALQPNIACVGKQITRSRGAEPPL